MEVRKEWYETWFDSPYYHILYDHRDTREAESFILRIKEQVGISATDRVLDLACGAGRHAAFLAGFAGEVIGVDLSRNSIREANLRFRKPNLEYYTHDMRQPFRINYFDLVVNFFTSFGYFRQTSENLSVLKAARTGLAREGRILIDFMNAEKAVQDLVERETIRKQDIDFYIRREVVDGKINKHIKFDAEGRVFSFTESVQAFGRQDFHDMLDRTGFDILDEYGDYELSPFDVHLSPRYIVLAKVRAEQ